jgi:hypothetical protein
MSTIQDYRRTDLSVYSSKGAFWINSKAIDGHEQSDLKDKACVLFSFAIADQQIIIREIVVRVLTPFTTGTTLELGSYTLATENVSTNDTATVVDDDAYVTAIDILPETAGYYYPTRGGFVDAQESGIVVVGENLIVGAATNVPAIVISPKVATIIIGKVQVYMLVCIVPGI